MDVFKYQSMCIVITKHNILLIFCVKLRINCNYFKMVTYYVYVLR